MTSVSRRSQGVRRKTVRLGQLVESIQCVSVRCTRRRWTPRFFVGVAVSLHLLACDGDGASSGQANPGGVGGAAGLLVREGGAPTATGEGADADSGPSSETDPVRRGETDKASGSGGSSPDGSGAPSNPAIGGDDGAPGSAGMPASSASSTADSGGGGGMSGTAGTSSAGGAPGTVDMGAGGTASGSGGASSAGGTSSDVNLSGLDLRWGMCADDGDRSCYGIDQRIQLICFDYTPEVYGVCEPDERCDTREENLGNCAKMLPECVGQDAYFGLCDGSTYFECGVNKITRAYEEACTDRCVVREGGADCIHAGCGNGTLDPGEACDDGNNDNGDGCTATCQWGPPLGDVQPGNDFGSSVAMDGDRIAISGTVYLEGTGARQSIYVFKRNGIAWEVEDRILLDDDPGLEGARIKPEDALAISGDTLAFGGSVVGDGQDSAFILRRQGTEWTFEARVTAMLADSEADETGGFALALDLDGDVLAVGAGGDADQGSFAGAVYVYRRTGTSWAPEGKLYAQLPDGTLDAEASDGFGDAIAVSGERIVVGALGDDDVGSYTGAAYVYSGSEGTWQPEAKLLGAGSSDAEEGAQCGSGVDIQGDTLVVGCRYAQEVELDVGARELGNYAGTAYVFRRVNGAWQRQALLLPLPGTRPEDDKSIATFGQRVAISDSEDLIAVGSPRDKIERGRVGSAHVFRLVSGTWGSAQKLVPEAPRGVGIGEGYGKTLAVSGQSVLVGGSGTSTGRAYLYQLTAEGWQERLRLLAVVP